MQLEKDDYYWDNGKIVLTESYLLKRGRCCNNGCRHCPYGDKMEIIKRGTPDSNKTAEFTCRSCQSKLSAKKSEGKYIYDFRDGDCIKFICPVCKNDIYVKASLFSNRDYTFTICKWDKEKDSLYAPNKSICTSHYDVKLALARGERVFCAYKDTYVIFEIIGVDDKHYIIKSDWDGRYKVHHDDVKLVNSIYD